MPNNATLAYMSRPGPGRRPGLRNTEAGEALVIILSAEGVEFQKRIGTVRDGECRLRYPCHTSASGFRYVPCEWDAQGNRWTYTPSREEP